MTVPESPYIEEKGYASRFTHGKKTLMRGTEARCLAEFGSEDEWLRCVRDEFPQYLPFLKKRCRLQFRGRILEIGAGAAWLSAELSKLPNVVQVVATDFSPKLLKEQAPRIFRLLKASSGKITRTPADFHQLHFADGTFDFVVCASALHDAVSIVRVLKEAARVLKPGGKFVAIREPVRPLLKSAARTARKRPDGVGKRLYTLAEYRGFFSQAGLKLETQRVNLSSGFKYYFNEAVNGLTHARYALVATK
jgi:ubiquinone/menaquinone biosynthesis C-methylase UbiE